MVFFFREFYFIAAFILVQLFARVQEITLQFAFVTWSL